MRHPENCCSTLYNIGGRGSHLYFLFRSIPPSRGATGTAYFWLRVRSILQMEISGMTRTDRQSKVSVDAWPVQIRGEVG